MVNRALGSSLARLHRMSGEERQSVERDLASELAPDPNVVFAYLYGSFVDAQPFHDVDVGVYLQTLRPEAATTVALDWSQRLSGRLRMPVDVRILNAAPVSFQYHVLRGRLVVCRDDAVLATVWERIVSRYLDLAPMLRRGAQEAFAA